MCPTPVPISLPTPEQLRALYRERAHLIALLTTRYPAQLAHNDEAEPELPVLYLHTPAGQITWHVHPHDLDLFGHVEWANELDTLTLFDGHDKPEALARLRRLVELEMTS